MSSYMNIDRCIDQLSIMKGQSENELDRYKELLEKEVCLSEFSKLKKIIFNLEKLIYSLDNSVDTTNQINSLQEK